MSFQQRNLLEITPNGSGRASREWFLKSKFPIEEGREENEDRVEYLRDRETERDKETERQRDRETERQRDRETERQRE